jgi:hypothetical protein
MALFGASLLLFWAGYYAGLFMGFRAGLPRVPLLLAAIVGVCGCFGVPILGWIWAATEKKQIETLGSATDFDPVVARRERTALQVAMAMALVGLVGQVFVGRLTPEPSYGEVEVDEPAYDEPAYDEWAETGTDYDAEAETETETEAETEPEAEAEAETEAEPEAETVPVTEPEPETLDRLWVLATSSDRRIVAVTDGRGTLPWLVRSRRPLPAFAAGDRLTVEGVRSGTLLEASAVTRTGEGQGAAIPSPRVVTLATLHDDVEGFPVWAALRGAVAVDGSSVAPDGAPEPRVALRLPRGVRVRAGARFTTLRGVLLDTSALGVARGGLELWVGAVEDVVVAE